MQRPRLLCRAAIEHIGARDEGIAPAIPDSGLQSAASAMNAFYRFSRPHTMFGTFISVMSVSAMAMVRHADCRTWTPVVTF